MAQNSEMSTRRELLVDGLKDAHAMEQQARLLCQRQIDRLERYPELSARLQQHARETEAQINRLEQCLQRLGTETSGLKAAALMLAAAAKTAFQGLTADEVLKNTLADVAFENYEIAAYSALAIIAESANETALGSLIRQSLAEEQAMAEWLNQNLPHIVHRYLDLAATPGVEERR